MKTNLTYMKQLFTLIFSLLFVFATEAQKKNTTITMVVNTAEINQNNKNQMVSFYDSDGNRSTSGNHADFLSIIDTDKFVFWYGQVQDLPSNPGDVVNVTMMEMKDRAGNKQLLKSKKYKGTNFIRGKVKKNYEEGEMAYTITFTVIRNGVATEYTIDPKLKIRN